MSQNKKNLNSDFLDVLKGSAIMTLFSLPIFLLIGLVLSFALLKTGSPESFYGFAKFILLIIPSFFIGKVIVKKYKTGRILYSLLFSVLLCLILILLSLFFDLQNFDFLSILINLIIIFLSTLLGVLTTNGKKKKTHHKKRK